MPTANTKIGICGASGRMGRALIHAVVAREDVKLTAAIEREGNTLIGADAGEMAALPHMDISINSSLASQ
ncbi:MAG: 4-hydroxy-tetrahydrodipicolinate reductase, partial [Pseudomonadales bacterium]|nr:4-hydroxy-tetrahydrodipicolinate reductase [Pseudomonadales bacterium]